MSPRPKCLNCGKPLRSEMTIVEREATSEELQQFVAWQDKLEAARERRDNAVTTAREYDEAYAVLEKLRNKKVPRPFKLTGSDKQFIRTSIPTGKYGQSALGLFCKRACGEAFGVAAALAGYRRKA